MITTEQNYAAAERDYRNGMKYKEIAAKYGVSINTVKSWKTRKWSQKGVHTKKEKVCTQNATHRNVIEDGTKETLGNNDLTPEQQMFCIYYSKSFNATQSYLKAYGSSYNTAMCNGSRLLGIAKVKKEIERLKEIKRQQVICEEADLVEMHMRIAFSDIGDYVSFGREEQPVITMHGPLVMEDEETGEKKEVTREANVVKIKESVEVDTQIVQEVKQGRDGTSIKLADKQKSLDWLDKHFLCNPMDRHKQEYDRMKMELELLKIESQFKEEAIPEEDLEDNFMDAMNAAAKEVWSDEK